MAKCELTLMLDRPDGVYATGDRIQGVVGVAVNKACRCDGLRVKLLWRTHGRGNRDQGVVEVDTVYEGDWLAGERHAHDFSFTLPPGPLSYRGNLVNIDWYVRAEADIPWAFDPKAEQGLLLVAGPSLAHVDHGPSWVARQGAVESSGLVVAGVMGSLVVGSVSMLVVGFGVVLFMALASGGAALVGLPFLCIMGVLPLLFGAILVAALRPRVARWQAERSLGEVEVELANEARAGQELVVGVRFTPQRTIPLESISAVLTGTEVAISGSGTNRHTHRKPMARVVGVLAQAGSLPAGKPVDLVGAVRLPDDAAPSFMAYNNKLLWSVQVRIDVPGWADWTRDYALTVEPPVRAGAPAQ